MNRLEWFYKNDKRALLDFIGCIEHCDGCRAREMCDEYTAENGRCGEAEFLMRDMPSCGAGE